MIEADMVLIKFRCLPRFAVIFWCLHYLTPFVTLCLGIYLENTEEFQLPDHRMNFTAWLFVLAHVNVSPVKV